MDALPFRRGPRLISLLYLSLSALSANILAKETLGPKCEIVTVLAQAKAGDKTYLQSGTGTVFARKAGDPDVHIFVPNHVISGADEFRVFCDQKAIATTLLKGSAIGDQAVLKVSEKDRASLRPFFDLQSTSKKDSFVRGEIHIPKRGSESSPERLDYFGTTIANHPYQPTLGNNEGYLFGGIGVRPGMSGSPSRDPKTGAFLGTVTKTKIGAPHSYGLTAASIRRAIPPLMEGRDPHLDEKANPSLRIEEKLVPSKDGKRLYRHRVLHVKAKDDSNSESSPPREYVFEDRCPSSSFTETSGWLESGGWGDGGAWGDGGGWGDGTGNTSTSSGGGFTIGTVVNPDSEPEILRTQWRSFFDRPNDCQENGIQVLQGADLLGGETLLALRPIPGSPFYERDLTRIDSVDKLYKLYELQGPEFLNNIKKYGVYDKAESDGLGFLCSSGPFRSDNALRVCGDESDGQLIKTPQGLLAVLRSSIQLEPLQSAIARNAGAPLISYGGVSCDAADGRIEAQLQSDLYEVNLSLTRSKIFGGVLRIGTCEIRDFQFSKSLWSGKITSEDFDVEVEFPDDPSRIVSLKPTRIDPKCLKAQLGEVLEKAPIKIQWVEFVKPASSEELAEVVRIMIERQNPSSQ